MQQPFDTDTDGDLDFTDFNVYVACWVSQGVESATWTSTPEPSATSTPPNPTATSTPTIATATPTRTAIAPTATSTATPTPTSGNTIQQILADSSGPHDGCLNRLAPIESYDWFSEASPNPDAHEAPGNTHVTFWGQFAYNHSSGPGCTGYVATVPNPLNVRVQMRNAQTYVFANGVWRRLDTGPQGYGVFPVTFQSLPPGETCGSAPSRAEASGGMSWRMMPNNKCLIHPWGGFPRAAVPAGTVCVWSTAEVRLIKDDPNGPDNLDQARVLANVGADLYGGAQDTTSPVDWGIGAFRVVGRDFRSINMSSCTASFFQQFPPPL